MLLSLSLKENGDRLACTMAKVIAVIPARGGSKGIPRKNIVELCGKPLIGWTICAAKKSQIFDRIVISTDSEEIASVATEYGAEVLCRPSEISGDLSTTDDVLLHLIQNICSEDDILVLLQPTSPLRTADHIVQAFKLYQADPRVRMVMSTVPLDSSVLKCFLMNEDGTLSGAFSSDAPFMPRQILPNIFSPNGAIYIFSAPDFMLGEKLPRCEIKGFVMDKESSVDIDSVGDLLKAKTIIEKRGLL